MPVKIENTTDSEVTVEDRENAVGERELRVFVRRAVAEDVANNGIVGQAMSGSYAIKRRFQ